MQVLLTDDPARPGGLFCYGIALPSAGDSRGSDTNVAIYGVHLAQVLAGTATVVLGLLAVVSVGILLVLRATAFRGRHAVRFVLEPAPVRTTRPAENTPPSVLLWSVAASRAPPGAWSNRPRHSSAPRAEE
jgi:hypothetical protein